MNSSCIMEPLHEIAGEVRKNHLAFGGIQVIIVCDRLQLKPIKEKFDSGKMAHMSPWFSQLIPHIIKLNKMY